MGGCFRCDNRDGQFQPGTAYDICICVHAEQNAVLSAARFGTPTEAPRFTPPPAPASATPRAAAGQVISVNFIHDWTHRTTSSCASTASSRRGSRAESAEVAIDDPRAAWAGQAAPRRVRPATGFP
ncbi:MAG: hypothetical protein IPH65_17755 [Dehalococcoidia bacterium]|uniref:hypothetical protein n=1 Tax=Candidatus Amarobacter glycogenicus TaxID=3140699 RepID=UPI003135CD4C|nr:hypothetical protein [Dehalococcoidia bacterium]